MVWCLIARVILFRNSFLLFNFWCVLKPSLGNSSCVSPEVTPLKQREGKKSRKHETDPDESFMNVEVDDDYECIPGTPPHKKVARTSVFRAYANYAIYLSVRVSSDHARMTSEHGKKKEVRCTSKASSVT